MNRPVVHPIGGRSDCLACHGSGASGAPGLPSTHDGMASSTCLTCHPTVAGGQNGVYGLGLLAALVFVVVGLRLLGGLAPRWGPAGRAP